MKWPFGRQHDKGKRKEPYPIYKISVLVYIIVSVFIMALSVLGDNLGIMTAIIQLVSTATSTYEPTPEFSATYVFEIATLPIKPTPATTPGELSTTVAIAQTTALAEAQATLLAAPSTPHSMAVATSVAAAMATVLAGRPNPLSVAVATPTLLAAVIETSVATPQATPGIKPSPINTPRLLPLDSFDIAEAEYPPRMNLSDSSSFRISLKRTSNKGYQATIETEGNVSIASLVSAPIGTPDASIAQALGSDYIPIISADLVGSSFDIVRASPITQPYDIDHVDWIWNIKPKSLGDQELNASLFVTWISMVSTTTTTTTTTINPQMARQLWRGQYKIHIEEPYFRFGTYTLGELWTLLIGAGIAGGGIAGGFRWLGLKLIAYSSRNKTSSATSIKRRRSTKNINEENSKKEEPSGRVATTKSPDSMT